MKIQFFVFCFCLLIMASCKSSTEPGPSYNFFPLTVGSYWKYTGDKTFTRTVIGDTVINGKTYAIIKQSNNDSLSYYRKDGNIIYSLRRDTANVFKDFMYVNPTPGGSGKYSIFTLIGASELRLTNVTWSNTRMNFADTINGKPYSNVMVEHVRSVIVYHDTSSSSQFSTTEGDYYFADGVGLIDQLVSPSGTELLVEYQIR